MKTYLFALAASALFATAALADDLSNTDPNMQPAPATTATTESTSTPAPTPAPVATTTSMPDDKPKVDDKPLTADKAAPVQKKVDEHHAKYHNGEGSTWKTGRNSYGFEGTYGGCQFRGHAGLDGYHIDKAC